MKKARNFIIKNSNGDYGSMLYTINFKKDQKTKEVKCILKRSNDIKLYKKLTNPETPSPEHDLTYQLQYEYLKPEELEVVKFPEIKSGKVEKELSM